MEYKHRQLKIAGVIRESIVDGPGIRFVIFAQGCYHNCEGCQNPNTHDCDGGYWCDFDKILEAVDKNPMVNGITFSGGEPFLQARALTELAIELKTLKTVDKIITKEGDTRRITKKERPRDLHLMAYTGYTLENLAKLSKSEQEGKYIVDFLSHLDVLIDGPFILKERDLGLEFRGSRNQRYLKREEINRLIY